MNILESTQGYEEKKRVTGQRYAHLDWVVREGLTEEVRFELRLKNEE